jgi:hypothetical protein
MRRTLIDSLPVLVLGAYFVVGFAAYLVRCAVKGVPRDLEMEARGGSAILGIQLRHYFVWIVSPFWRLLLATGVRADTVTLAAALLGGGGSLAMALGSSRSAAACPSPPGFWMRWTAAARFRSRPARQGRRSIRPDRYVDFALLAGLGWYYRGTLALLTVLLAMLGSFRSRMCAPREPSGSRSRTGSCSDRSGSSSWAAPSP